LAACGFDVLIVARAAPDFRRVADRTGVRLMTLAPRGDRWLDERQPECEEPVLSNESLGAEQLLAGNPLFSGLSKRQVRKLLDISREVDHPPGHVIAAEGSGALALHLIESGEAAVSVRGTEVRTIGPGDYFGEMSLIDGKPRSATVTARTPLRILVVPYQAFQRLIDDEPAFARALLVSLSERIRDLQSH
jgi:CRP/FNR family transcriptional regulator, cyclic AMP receptor protein